MTLLKKKTKKSRKNALEFHLSRREGESEQHYRKRFHRVRLFRQRIPICLAQILVLALCFSLPLKLLLISVMKAGAEAADPLGVVEVAATVSDTGATSLFFLSQLVFLMGFEWFVHRLARKMRHRAHSGTRLFLCKLIAYGLFAVLTAALYIVLGREGYLWVFSVTAVFNDYAAYQAGRSLWFSLVLFHGITAAIFLLEPLYQKMWHEFSGGLSAPRLRITFH